MGARGGPIPGGDERGRGDADGRRNLGLGTFLGVFTPTVLTILGVIMYLRSGWVVSHAGLGGALVIIGLANGITLITALSMSALATNMKVGPGGAYYLISRSLGIEVGGAIGIPLYMAQALSVTLYSYGLSESTLTMLGLGDSRIAVQVGAAVVVVAVAGFASRSTELTLKAQLPIMACIALSLVSLFAGVAWGESGVPAFGFSELGFFAVFAVFFPAVTGIDAGMSMSGDLADPARSMPRGILAAVLVGFAVYMTVPIALAHAAANSSVDLTGTLAWTGVAAVPLLVFPGMLGAILSSAFGSVLAAPRTLQALALDRLVPPTLGESDAESGEPLRALFVTAAIALLAVLLGELNSVAAVLTMFFLTSYGTLNLVAGLEALVGDPSFRPGIRVPWWVSFLGAGGCLIAMLAIHPVAALIALAVELGIYLGLRRQAMEAAWGDVRSGLWMAAARYALLSLRSSEFHARNWRPHVLQFTRDLRRDLPLARLASDLGQGRGIVTISTLVDATVELAEQERRREANAALLEAAGILAFPEVEQVRDLEGGVVTVAQANGFAGLSSNTVLFGWPSDPTREAIARLLRLERSLAAVGKCTLIARLDPREEEAGGPMVVWWKGREANGDLMLLLAHLLSLSETWRRCRIVLKSVVDSEGEQRERARLFRSMREEIRIDFDIDIVVRGEQPVWDVLRTHSRGAALVFVGLASGDRREEEAAALLARELPQLPSALLVRNASPFRGRLV